MLGHTEQCARLYIIEPFGATTTIAILLGLSPLSLLVYSQVLLSLFIPLPMIPLVYYTSRKKIMGAFVNRRWLVIVACIVAGTIVALNVALFAGLQSDSCWAA